MRGEFGGKLDGLVFNANAAESDIVSADLAGGGAAITILDLPRRTTDFLVGGGCSGVEDVMFWAAGGFGLRFGVEEGGPYLRVWSVCCNPLSSTNRRQIYASDIGLIYSLMAEGINYIPKDHCCPYRSANLVSAAASRSAPDRYTKHRSAVLRL